LVLFLVWETLRHQTRTSLPKLLGKAAERLKRRQTLALRPHLQTEALLRQELLLVVVKVEMVAVAVEMAELVGLEV
jgi:hypothetical protein